jgi:hypothetical protein
MIKTLRERDDIHETYFMTHGHRSKGSYMKRLSFTNTGTVFTSLLFHINLQIDLIS